MIGRQKYARCYFIKMHPNIEHPITIELKTILNNFQYQTDDFGEASNREERRIERMIRKTGRDIYRLRKTKTSIAGKQPGDIISFK